MGYSRHVPTLRLRRDGARTLPTPGTVGLSPWDIQGESKRRARERWCAHGERVPAPPHARAPRARGRRTAARVFLGGLRSPRSLLPFTVHFSAQSVPAVWRHSRGAHHRNSLARPPTPIQHPSPGPSSARRQSLESLSLLGIDAQRHRPAAPAARAGPMELESEQARLAWAG